MLDVLKIIGSVASGGMKEVEINTRCQSHNLLIGKKVLNTTIVRVRLTEKHGQMLDSLEFNGEIYLS